MRSGILLLILTLLCFNSDAEAQQEDSLDSVWTLEQCIRYAQQNNLSVKKAELDKRSSQMNYGYSRYKRLPSVNFNSSYGNSFGRSINPTTNAFENTRFASLGLNASANVLLFGWFEQKYALQKTSLQNEMSTLELEQTKSALVMTVATAYLRALLADEQATNTLDQIALSIYNQQRIEKLLKAGKSNVLEQSQAAAGLSADSGAYLQAQLNYEQAIIDLKAVLNLDFTMPIKLSYAPAEWLFFLPKLDAEAIMVEASYHLPQVQNNQLKLRMTEKDIAIAKTKLYPRLSLYISSGTNYSSSYYETLPNGETQSMALDKQFRNNIAQSAGISLSMPILNGLLARQSIRNAKIALQSAEVNSKETMLKLKQDIYKACIDYQLTFEKYRVAQNALNASELAFKAATTRYEYGFINFYEYLTEKNNFLKIKNETTALKYELYFKKLGIDYFQGVFR